MAIERDAQSQLLLWQRMPGVVRAIAVGFVAMVIGVGIRDTEQLTKASHAGHACLAGH